MPSSREIHARDDLATDVIALTFDDGPAEWTVPILETLRREGVRATFFVIGESVQVRESVLVATVADGHEIGNHSLTHPLLPDHSREEIRHELTTTSEIISAAIGQTPRVFRPPYLGVSPDVLDVAGECGFEWTVQASVWTDDWNLPTGEAIVKGVLPHVQRGSIIDLHDGRPLREPRRATRADRWPTVHAVATLVPLLLARGFEFVTVSELLAF